MEVPERYSPNPWSSLLHTSVWFLRGEAFLHYPRAFRYLQGCLRSGDVDLCNDLLPLMGIEAVILEHDPVEAALKHPSLKQRREAEQDRRANEKTTSEAGKDAVGLGQYMVGWIEPGQIVKMFRFAGKPSE